MILHGLMGGLQLCWSIRLLPKNGYRVIIPELPIYDLPLKQTNVAEFAEYLHRFLTFKGLKDVILLGNSFGWAHWSSFL